MQLLCCLLCLQFHDGECPYEEDKRLSYTHLAVMECPKGCKGMGKADAKLCRVSSCWVGGE